MTQGRIPGLKSPAAYPFRQESRVSRRACVWLSLTPTPRRAEPGVASRAEGRCPLGVLCIPCLSPGARGERGAHGEKGEPLPSPGAPGRLCRGLGGGWSQRPGSQEVPLGPGDRLGEEFRPCSWPRPSSPRVGAEGQSWWFKTGGVSGCQSCPQETGNIDLLHGCGRFAFCFFLVYAHLFKNF